MFVILTIDSHSKIMLDLSRDRTATKMAASIRFAHHLRCMRSIHVPRSVYSSLLQNVNLTYCCVKEHQRNIGQFTSNRKKVKFLAELYRRKLEDGPDPVRHPSEFGCWSHDAEIFAFGQRFGEEFDEELLKTAFRQASYIEKEAKKQSDLGLEIDKNLEDNLDLADEGRLIANRYIKAYLRHSFPDVFEEGILAISEHLMSDDTLHHIASNLGLTDIIQSADYPPQRQEYITTLLAVLGALSKSQGEHRAEMFVHDFIVCELVGKDINEIWHVVDPMGLLAAILKSEGRAEPEARLLWKSGSNVLMSLLHVGIYCDKELIGKSAGETIQIAEEMAAREGIKKVMKTMDWRAPMVLGPRAHDLELDYSKTNRRASDLMT